MSRGKSLLARRGTAAQKGRKYVGVFVARSEQVRTADVRDCDWTWEGCDKFGTIKGRRCQGRGSEIHSTGSGRVCERREKVGWRQGKQRRRGTKGTGGNQPPSTPWCVRGVYC